MMRAKYNAWDLKKAGGSLPEDVNGVLVDIAARFEYPPLIEAIDHARRGLLHGRLLLLDAASVEIAGISIRRGIVYDADLQRKMLGKDDYKPRRPYALVWKQHLRNDAVTWQKNKKGE